MKYFVLLFTLFLTACNMFGSNSAEVTFHIPDLPEEMQALKATNYRVVVAALDGRREFTVCQSHFKVKVPVSGITTVLAYPAGNWGELKPAGFIVHGNLKAHNYLTWNDGFAAECTALSLASGAALENFNFTMFQQKLMEKSEGNPWILNRDRVIYALSYGIFNMNYIKKADSHVLSLPLSGTGFWYSGTPGCIQQFAQRDGYIADLPITEGENIFVNPETEKCLAIYADQLTWICISETTGGLSGYW